MADQHAVLAQGRDDLARLADFVPIHLEDHDVGVDAVGVHGQAVNIGEAGGQPAGVGVVVGQPLNHRVQGHELSGRGQDAGLLRMPPPTIFRHLRARVMNSSEPHSTEPTGQDRAFERQKLTSSTSLVSSDTGTSEKATAALKIRAPSR